MCGAAEEDLPGNIMQSVFLFQRQIDEKLIIKMFKNVTHLSESLGTKQKVIWTDQFKSSGSVHLQLCVLYMI